MIRQRRARAWDEYVLSRWGRRDSQQWPSWAAAHGWSYRSADPTLVGVYLRHRPAEAANCVNVLDKVVRGRPVRAFEYESFQGGRHGHGTAGAVSALVVFDLPGRPPAEVVAPGLGVAITRLGGSVPSGSDVSLHGSELVLWRPGRLTPQHLVNDVELMTRQIEAMPETFWRSAP